MTINHLLLILYVVSSCGGGDVPAFPSSSSSSNESSGEPSKVDPELSVDLAKLSSMELEEMADTLKKRNEAEKKEILTLKALNPKLCSRLKTLRDSCQIAVTLMTDEATSKLDCGDGTTTPPHTITVTLNATGKYEMIADNLLKSQVFESGTSELKFTPIAGGRMTSNPKFIDIRKLVLRRTDGEAPNEMSAFTLKVNESEVLNGSDLTKKGGDTLEISLVKFMNLADSCHVSSAELQAIRSSVSQALSLPEKKSETAPAATSEATSSAEDK